jgi:hypothetical protein
MGLEIALRELGASGATDVEPLMEMVVLAAAVDAGRMTARATTARTRGGDASSEESSFVETWTSPPSRRRRAIL